MTLYPWYSCRTFIVFCSLLVAILGWTGARAADMATTATVTLPPSRDTFVHSANPGTNYGAGEELLVYEINSTAVIHAQSLLYFDLSSLPAGTIIERAILRLYVTDLTNPQPSSLQIDQVLAFWDEASVTWGTRPQAVNVYPNVPPPTQIGWFSVDVTELVARWVHQPSVHYNDGLQVRGYSFAGAGITFSSREGSRPPELIIDYTAPATAVDIPIQANARLDLDGLCDSTGQGEYAGGAHYRYVDHEGAVSDLYLLQDATDLYLCVEGVATAGPERSFAVYLDRDNGKEKYAESDDISLRVRVQDGETSSYVGTGDSVETYTPEPIDGWEAVARVGEPRTLPDSAEFRIPLDLLTARCGSPFGLAVFHEAVTENGGTYGWPSDIGPRFPETWVETLLESPPCPIRVCLDSATACTPAGLGAQVFRVADGRPFDVDALGYVQERDQIFNGDALWALVPMTVTQAYTVYYTSGVTQTVDYAAFNAAIPGEMTLVATADQPLMLFDLVVSTEWNLTPAEEDALLADLAKASDYLYAFTDGQAALGQVTIYQNLTQWGTADVRNWANNRLRPEADPGGMVLAPVTDPIYSDLTYYPGHIHLGSYWNRFNTPPGQPIVLNGAPVDPSTLADDRALALAHEFGHYFFYLFDTYFGLDDEGHVVEVDSCTGSAMGWVYEEKNWAFVADPVHWNDNCSDTYAHRVLPRHEWATIQLWYPWLRTPPVITAAQLTPPVPLTRLTVQPSASPGTPLLNPTFNLLYQNGETASREARALIIRDDRVLDQGAPPQGSTQITLVGPQENDRLCVVDINQNDAPAARRYQYGCEEIQIGDNELWMERDITWAPIIEPHPVTSTTWQITVTQPLAAGLDLKLRLYPEGKPGSTPADLSAGDVHTATVTLPEVTPAAYIQVWVDETDTETNPARVAFIDYGIGGGTVPGPASFGEKAPVYSADGVFEFYPDATVELVYGEFVSVVRYLNTYPLPANTVLAGAPYGLVAYPPSLIGAGTVHIRYTPPDTGGMVGATLQAPAGEEVAIHFWNGQAWQPLETTVTPEPTTGQAVATARGHGPGIYVLLVVDPDFGRIYFPYISR